MVNVQVKNVAMPSNKHSGRRRRTQILAVHSAESPLERGYAKSLTNWSNTAPQVLSSWNTFIDPGVCVRAVNTYNASWHASWANSLSVGYEQAGYAAFSRDTWMSLEGRRQLERLAIEMAADAEIFDIPLRWLTQAQVNAIRAGNTRIKGLASHAQIDPAYRTDPGTGFPYGYLLKRIKAHSRGHAGAPSAAQGPVTKPAAETVKPIKEEDDDMPKASYYDNFKDQPLKKDEWVTLGIEDGSNRVSIVTGSYANLVNGHAIVYAQGIEPGFALKLEWYRVDEDGAAKGYGPVEINDNAGGCAGEINVLCNMPSGGENRLRLRALTYQDGVVVKSVRARAHYWG